VFRWTTDLYCNSAEWLHRFAGASPVSIGLPSGKLT
jgi:hypothetical protein